MLSCLLHPPNPIALHDCPSSPSTSKLSAFPSPHCKVGRALLLLRLIEHWVVPRQRTQILHQMFLQGLWGWQTTWCPQRYSVCFNLWICPSSRYICLDSVDSYIQVKFGVYELQSIGFHKPCHLLFHPSKLLLISCSSLMNVPQHTPFC